MTHSEKMLYRYVSAFSCDPGNFTKVESFLQVNCHRTLTALIFSIADLSSSHWVASAGTSPTSRRGLCWATLTQGWVHEKWVLPLYTLAIALMKTVSTQVMIARPSPLCDNMLIWLARQLASGKRLSDSRPLCKRWQRTTTTHDPNVRSCALCARIRRRFWRTWSPKLKNWSQWMITFGTSVTHPHGGFKGGRVPPTQWTCIPELEWPRQWYVNLSDPASADAGCHCYAWEISRLVSGPNHTKVDIALQAHQRLLIQHARLVPCNSCYNSEVWS